MEIDDEDQREKEKDKTGQSASLKGKGKGRGKRSIEETDGVARGSSSRKKLRGHEIQEERDKEKEGSEERGASGVSTGFVVHETAASPALREDIAGKQFYLSIALDNYRGERERIINNKYRIIEVDP